MPSQPLVRLFALAACAILLFTRPALAQIEEPKPIDQLKTDAPKPVQDQPAADDTPSTPDPGDQPDEAPENRAKVRLQPDTAIDEAEPHPVAPKPEERHPKGSKAEAKKAEPAKPAPAPRPPPKPILVPQATDAELVQTWERWRRSTVELNAKAAEAAQTELVRLKDDLGIADLEQFSVGFARAADAQRQAGNAAAAVNLATVAATLAPNLPMAHFALAEAYFSAEPLGIGRTLSELQAGVGQMLKDPRYLRPIVMDLCSAIIFALMATAIAVVLMLFLRRARYFFHDIHHLLPRAAARWHSAAMATLLLLLPAGFHLGIAPTLLVLFAASALYLSLAERAVAAALIALLALLPLVGGAVISLTRFSGTLAEDVYLLERGGLTAKDAADRVSHRLSDGKADFPEVFALGRYELRRGQLDRAVEHLKLAAAKRNNDPRTLTNLATAMLAKGDPDGALELYKNATQLDGTLPAAYFDLGKLYYRRAAVLPDDQVGVELDKAHTALQAAQRLDESLLTRPDPPDDNLQLNRLLLSPSLTTSEIAALAGTSEAPEKIQAQLSAVILGPINPPLAWIYPVLGALALFGLGFLAPRLATSKCCDKCGRPVCRRCDPELAAGGMLCGQCVNVFARKGLVPAPIRVRKQLEIQRHRSRTDRLSYLFGLIWSGAGHLFAGLPIRGALYAFSFSFVLFCALFRQGVLRAPYAGLPQLATLLPLVIAFLAVYLLSLRGLYKETSE